MATDDVPDFYTGSPIDPDDLWFRDEFISDLWEELRKQHVVLSAPRRTGKTSVMDHLFENPRNDYVVIQLFVQDLAHPSEFIISLLDAFYDRYPDQFKKVFEGGSQFFKDVLGHIKSIGAGGFKIALRNADPDWKNNWKKHGESMFRIIRNESDKVLFVVDEFPDYVLNIQKENRDELRPFLAWFRGHRIKPRPKKDNIRWLLGGSVNLSSTLDSLNCIDQINDLHIETLPILSQEQVEEFVTTMLRGRNVVFSKEIPAALAKKIGRPIPLFLQMLTQDLYKVWKKKKTELSIEDLEKAFDNLVISSNAKDKLQHFYSRIERYYSSPKDTTAYKILGDLAVTEGGLNKKKLCSIFDQNLIESGIKLKKPDKEREFQRLLRDLENDFYIVEINNNIYDFSSGVLKAWWKKFYA